MALLPAHSITTGDNAAGLNLQPASAGGDTFANDGRLLFLVSNTSPDAVTLMFTSRKPCDQGFTHDRAVTVPTGAPQPRFVGPFPTARYNDPVSGLVTVTYSSVTGITVGVGSL